MKIGKIVKIAIVFIVLFMIEFKFDLIEIAIGSIMEWTNDGRPKSGELWDKAINRQAAAEELGILREQNRLDEEELDGLRFFSDAVHLVEDKGDYVMNGMKFIELYKTLSRQTAEQIIAPLHFLEFINDESIKYSLFGRSAANLKIILINDQNEILHQSEVPLENFAETGGARITNRINQTKFLNNSDKIVTRDLFFNAYNELTENIRLQIVNDPFQLVVWSERLLRVAILEDESKGVIPVIFEVRTGNKIEYVEFQARPLAVYYLIQRLNDLEEKSIR
ncbi:MAG: hypothetical protein GY863_09490 [bacterium]|nr:hypothetical protein [bacterium]